jgi:hypothetical protein
MFKRSEQLVGAKISRLGHVFARDPDYLSWLHTQLAGGKIKRLEPQALFGGSTEAHGYSPKDHPFADKTDLHHFSKARRSNDYYTVAIPHGLHMHIEQRASVDKMCTPRFYAWATEMAWRYHNPKPPTREGYAPRSTRSFVDYLDAGGDLQDHAAVADFRLKRMLKEAGKL